MSYSEDMVLNVIVNTLQGSEDLKKYNEVATKVLENQKKTVRQLAREYNAAETQFKALAAEWVRISSRDYLPKGFHRTRSGNIWSDALGDFDRTGGILSKAIQKDLSKVDAGMAAALAKAKSYGASLIEAAESGAAAQASKGSTIGQMFWGGGKGTALQRMMTGSGFGSMFMRWTVLSKIMEMGNWFVTDALMGRSLAEIGKKQFALGGIDFNSAQLAAAALHARRISGELKGQVSTADMMNAISEAGSAQQVNEVGVGELAHMAELGAKLGLLGKTDTGVATVVIAKLQKAFEGAPEMKGLTIGAQTERLANMVAAMTGAEGMGWVPDVVQFMKHSLGTTLFRGMTPASMLAYFSALSNVGYAPGQSGRMMQYEFGPKGEESLARIILAGGPTDKLGELTSRKGQVSAKQLVRQTMRGLDFNALVNDPETYATKVPLLLLRALERGYTLKDLDPSAQWNAKIYHFLTKLAPDWVHKTKVAEEVAPKKRYLDQKLDAPMGSAENAFTAFVGASGRATEALSNILGVSFLLRSWAESLTKWTGKTDLHRIIGEAENFTDLDQRIGGAKGLDRLSKLYGSMDEAREDMRKRIVNFNPKLLARSGVLGIRAYQAWGGGGTSLIRSFLDEQIKLSEEYPDDSNKRMGGTMKSKLLEGGVIGGLDMANFLRTRSLGQLRDIRKSLDTDRALMDIGADPLLTSPDALGFIQAPGKVEEAVGAVVSTVSGFGDGVKSVTSNVLEFGSALVNAIGFIKNISAAMPGAPRKDSPSPPTLSP